MKYYYYIFILLFKICNIRAGCYRIWFDAQRLFTT